MTHTANPIYLDYLSTTPVDPRVKQAMCDCLTLEGDFGNASSPHIYGYRAQQAIQHAQQQVAALVNADPASIIWTSGATEANNLAIKGAAYFYQRQGKHIVSCVTEHKAVLDCCVQLQREGFDVTLLTPESNGLLAIEKLVAALRPDTILVSIMHANNEIGVLQDIAAIGQITRQRGIILHVDAAQSAGKVAINLQRLPVDLMSFSAHKVYGPKGIGALYIRSKPRLHLQPLLHGGGQQQGLRPGTLPVHQIVGMGAAFAIAQVELATESQRLLAYRQHFLKQLADMSGWRVNGDLTYRLPGQLSLSIEGIHGEALMWALQELALSVSSACLTASVEPSYVLTAIGLDRWLAKSTLRISFGRFTTWDEVERAAVLIKQKVAWLRSLSPLSTMKKLASPVCSSDNTPELLVLKKLSCSGLTWQHFLNPQNVGELDSALACVGTGSSGSQAVGEIVQVQLQVDACGMVEQYRFKVQGSGFTIAAGSWLTELVMGQSIQVIQTITHQHLVDALTLPAHAVHCAIMVVDALHAAIADVSIKSPSSVNLSTLHREHNA
ncbi:MAG: hypothetical protein Tsb005_19790 [Gammaproteobacteria bacterium]